MTGAVRAWLVASREARLEALGREATLVSLPYVLVVVLLVGLGLDRRTDLLTPVSPMVVWVVVLTTAVPMARLVAAAEHDDGTWELLRGLTSPLALVAGKTAAMWVALTLIWVLTALTAGVLLGFVWSLKALMAGVLGVLGLAVNTTALGLLIGPGTRRSGLLAALVLPTGIPLLLAGTRIADSAPATPWLVLLVVYDVVAVVSLWALAPLLVED